MLQLLLYREYPSFPIAPVVLSSFVAASAIFSISNVPSFRSPIGFSALLAAISQLICAALVLADFGTMTNWTQLTSPLFYSLKPVYHLFYSIYVSFMFVPGLIGFCIISKKKNSKIGIYTSYFGFAWTAMVTLIGLVLMILILTTLPRNDEYKGGPTDNLFRESVLKQVSVLYKMYTFISLSNWMLILISLTHYITQFRNLRPKCRYSLMTFSILNIIAVIFNTVVPFVSEKTGTLPAIIIMFVFGNLTSAIATIISIQYGHLWNTEKVPVISEYTDAEKSYDSCIPRCF